MKFRKKPVVIEAIQWTGSRNRFVEILKWANGVTGDNIIDGGAVFHPTVVGTDDDCLTSSWPLFINTLEGTMAASIGDWIIKGVNGEFYPCKPDIFAKTYERIEE